jgi:hypothetical protein
MTNEAQQGLFRPQAVAIQSIKLDGDMVEAEQGLALIDIRANEVNLQYQQQLQILHTQINGSEQSLLESCERIQLLNERSALQGWRYENVHALLSTGAISENEVMQQRDTILSLNQLVTSANIKPERACLKP